MAKTATKTAAPAAEKTAPKGDRAAAATQGAGLKRLRADPKAEAIRESVQADQQAAQQPPAKKPAEPAEPATAKPPKGDATKMIAGLENTALRVIWTENAKNPARENTKRWSRYDLLAKLNGRTVAEVLQAGVPSHTIAHAKERGIVKLQA